MGFGQAVASGLRQYARFSGRASRSEFWWFALFVLIVAGLAGIIDVLAGTAFVYPVAVIALFLPFLAVAVRRLHDTGRSGWYYLLLFIPLVGLIVYVRWAQQGERADNAYGPPTTAARPLAGY